MKVLVATKKGQGIRSNDFSWTDEGELVKFGIVCDGETDPDGQCGCFRDMCGVVTLKGTTTFMVADRDLSKKDYERELVRAEVRGGWIDADDIGEEDLKDIRREARFLLELAAEFPVGTVLEKRGEVLQERKIPRAAKKKATSPAAKKSRGEARKGGAARKDRKDSVKPKGGLAGKEKEKKENRAGKSGSDKGRSRTAGKRQTSPGK
jgi:hypothetical protein